MKIKLKFEKKFPYIVVSNNENPLIWSVETIRKKDIRDSDRIVIKIKVFDNHYMMVEKLVDFVVNGDNDYFEYVKCEDENFMLQYIICKLTQEN